MPKFFGSKKETEGRGTPENDVESKDSEGSLADERKDDSRKTQKRDLFRVVYPPMAAPKILDSNFHILLFWGSFLFTL